MQNSEPTVTFPARATQVSGGPEVLHYLGYNTDGGGICAVLRALESTGRMRCTLGVNAGFRMTRRPEFAVLELPEIAAESPGLAAVRPAARIAGHLREWLRRHPAGVVHTHSRAGLLVAAWLRLRGERRVIASVHCLGRQRWFFRAAAAGLGRRLYWLGPAMKSYYGAGAASWEQCLPDCVPDGRVRPARRLTRVRRYGCVGGLVPVKNWELVFEALMRVPAEAGVVIRHIGGEDDTPEGRACARRLRALAAQPALAGRVEWCRPAEDLTEFFSGIDCLLVASRWEASSMAALEALAAGVPVLASAASGTRDLIAACRGGWTFPADSAPELAARWVELATSPEVERWQRDDQGLRRFLASQAVEDYLAAYREVLAS